MKWNREAAGAAVRPRVFCASLADWLDPEWPIDVLADLLALVRATPNLDWLMLTKRPELWRERMDKAEAYQIANGHGEAQWLDAWRHHGRAPANVWVGTSVEDQVRADQRIPRLLEIPAVVRFLSVEPLLERVDLRSYLGAGQQDWGWCHGVSWVIVGGESGPCCRPMEFDWARLLLAQCRVSCVPFFMKQLGGMRDKRGALEDFPVELRVREFPVPQVSEAGKIPDAQNV